MVGGFNTNVSYLGRTFHVQTEDGGHESPQIITLLYEGGAILYSKKSSYATPDGDTAARGQLEETVRQLMEEQHRVMVEALKEGRLDSKIDATDQDDTEAADSGFGGEFGVGVISDKPLDELILEHLSAH